MIRLLLVICLSFCAVSFISGCTDFVEPNQLAFVVGTGVDLAEDGLIEISHQIVIPSQQNSPNNSGSGSTDSFFVMSAKGKNIFEATQKIQLKMSRKILTNHRALIVIGEPYFKNNHIVEMFDKLSRDPANNLRDHIIIVKGTSAKDFLMLKHPLEPFSSIAATKELQINGIDHITTRELIINSVTEGVRPVMPVVQIENIKMSSKKTEQNAVLSGYALLNSKLQIKEILDITEGSNAIWLTGKGTYSGVTISGKEGKGNLSFRLTHLNRRISTAKGNEPGHVVLTVTAEAYLLENTSELNMSETNNIIEVEQHLNDQMRMKLKAIVDKVQRCGTDIFGVGEYLHRRYPYWWKAMKDDWDEKFKTIDIEVQSRIQFRSIGVSGGQLK